MDESDSKEMIPASSPDAMVRALQEELRLLQLLPEDFRDLTPGSDLWMLYWKSYPEKQGEMLEWQQGPVLRVGVPLGLGPLIDLVEEAERGGFSFLDVNADFSEKLRLGFNQVLSAFNYNCRFRRPQ